MLVGAPALSVLGEVKQRSDEAARHLAALQPYFTPRSVFMHVGAEEGVLALLASAWVERVYAVDPVRALAGGARLPCNLRLVFSGDGPSAAIEAASVHVAFSERLLPERLAGIRRALAPGGVYLFYWSRGRRVAQERARLLEAGFARLRFPPLFAVFPRRQLIAAALRR